MTCLAMTAVSALDVDVDVDVDVDCFSLLDVSPSSSYFIPEPDAEDAAKPRPARKHALLKATTSLGSAAAAAAARNCCDE